jgi:hypothetical protein
MIDVPPLKAANDQRDFEKDTNPLCGNCKFFVANPPSGGLCKRYPPIVGFVPKQTAQGLMVMPQAAYTPVDPTDWCGEHARKLNS